MSRISSLALFGALVSTSAAFKWVGIQSEYTVGVPVTITWDFEGLDIAPERITLQHEEVGGFATDQYETLIEWVHPDDFAANSLQWTPNVAGPSFQLEMIGAGDVRTGDWGTGKFKILAADGSYVSTVPAGIERWSNILPQSVYSGVWPLSMAAAVGHTTGASASTTTSIAPSATVVASPSASSTEAVSTSSTEVSSTASITSIAVIPTTSAVFTSVPITTFQTSSSLAAIYPAGNTTVAGNSTSVGFSGPTSAIVYSTGAASTIRAGLGAVGVILGSLWFVL